MSNVNKNSYNYNSIYNMGLSEGFGYPFTSNDHQNHNPFMYRQLQNPAGLDPSHMSFTNCLSADVEYYDTLSTAFDLSCSSSEGLVHPVGATSGANPRNASASCSSSEAGVEEDSSKSKEDLQSKVCEAEDLKSKEVKGKRKGEKKERPPRFAFVTESEVDNLEDGYKWRKYGQKAVKNSPFPRSYYRCTTQKCNVKKRIERSSEDPSVVVTTYEGQHNHPCPASLQSFAAMLPPSLLSPTTSDFLFPASSYQDHLNHISPQHQQPQFLDQYNLSANMATSILNKPQPQ